MIFSGDAFAQTMFAHLYRTSVIPSFPRLLNDIEGRRTDGLGPIIEEWSALHDGIADGVQMSVFCNDDVPFFGEQAFRDATASVDPQLLEASIGITSLHEMDGSKAYCDEWSHPSPRPAENELVHSDIPALLIAGVYDPITPPEWAHLASSTLANSAVVEFPATSHGVLRARSECASQLMTAFLDDVHHPLDEQCARAIPTPQFELPSGDAMPSR